MLVIQVIVSRPPDGLTRKSRRSLRKIGGSAAALQRMPTSARSIKDPAIPLGSVNPVESVQSEKSSFVYVVAETNAVFVHYGTVAPSLFLWATRHVVRAAPSFSRELSRSCR